MSCDLLHGGSDPAYQVSRIEPSRSRRTRADLARLHDAMVRTVAEQQPMTLRQLFYALTASSRVGEAP